MFIQADINRSKIHQRNLYDTDWNLIPVQLSFPKVKDILKTPKNFLPTEQSDEVLFLELFFIFIFL